VFGKESIAFIISVSAATVGMADDYPIVVYGYPDYESLPHIIRLDTRDGTYRDPNFGNRYDGWAKFTQPSGIICQCTLRNGRAYEGTLIYPDGTIYVGFLASNRPNGGGEIKFPDGREYTGEFRRGVPNGPGRLREADRSYYQGVFKDGLPYRDVSYLSGDMAISYDGDFENGVPSFGQISFIDDVFGRTTNIGAFASAGGNRFALLLTGEGSMISQRRGELHGNFGPNGIEGFGIDLHWDDGSVYAGPYRNGKRNGQVGSIVFPNGVSSKLRGGTRIIGKFEDGVLSGDVTIIARDGRKTEAIMIDDQMVDFAKVDVFTGVFEDGKLVEIRSDREPAPNYFNNPAAVINVGDTSYRLGPDSVSQINYLTEKMKEGELLKFAGAVAPWLKLWTELLPTPYRPSLIGMAAEAGAPAINLALFPSEWDAYPAFLEQVDNIVKARLRGIIRYNIYYHHLTRGDDRGFWMDMLKQLQLGPYR
jgi:hypothetical protein